MGDRVPGVLAAWSSNLPGYHAVLAMHAFGLEESGDYERAGEFSQQALALNPLDARAHHVLAHVFEMTGRADAGVQWMHQRIEYWAADTVVATHCWWHLALFHLAQGGVGRALSLYDRRVRAGHSLELADLIDAAALLWRIELAGGEPGERWNELASAWVRHITDGFCTFNDLHAMIAFVGARDWDLAQRLERELAQRQSQRTRHGETTRLVGLPACRADRVRPRRLRPRDWSACPPAGAGTSHRWQPRAARCAAPHAAAGRRTHRPAREPAARRGLRSGTSSADPARSARRGTTLAGRKVP